MRTFLSTAFIAGLSFASVGAVDYDPIVADRAQYFSAAAYCGALVQNWECGSPCSNGPQVSEVVQLSNAKDGGQFAYVGYNA